MNDKLRAALAEMLAPGTYSNPPTVEDLASMAALFLRCVASELPDMRGKNMVEIVSLCAWEIDKRYGYGVGDRDGRGRWKAGDTTRSPTH